MRVELVRIGNSREFAFLNPLIEPMRLWRWLSNCISKTTGSSSPRNARLARVERSPLPRPAPAGDDAVAVRALCLRMNSTIASGRGDVSTAGRDWLVELDPAKGPESGRRGLP